MAITNEFRIKAIKYYLSTNKSLRVVAREFGINFISLYHWIKRYKKGGEDNLTDRPGPRRPWNRCNRTIESMVVKTREQKPGLSIRELHNSLKSRGIHISPKAIWNILNRYGLTEGAKNKTTISFDIRLYPATPEIKVKLGSAKELLDINKIREAARIINSLSICPDIDILNKMPDEYLSLKRQAEKFPHLFGVIPFTDYYHRMHQLRKKLERHKMYYSATRIGIEEILALQWMGRPQTMLSLISHLEQKIKGKGANSLKITLALLKGMAYASLFKIRNAKSNVAKFSVKKFTRFPFLCIDLTTFYASIGEIKKAILSAHMSLRYIPEKSKEIIYEYLSYLYSLAGEYSNSLKYLKMIGQKNTRLGLNILLAKAQYLLIQGLYDETLKLGDTILMEAKKEQVMPQIHAVSLIQAAVFSALGKDEEAHNLIAKYIPPLKKYKMHRDIALRYALRKRKINPKDLQFPPIRLIFLLKKTTASMKESNYRKAYDYAFRKGLLGILHRFIFFFPQCINLFLEKGEKPRLPQGLLRAPIFNKEIPVYHIKFLGSLVVYKNQEYLKTRLKPKDTAFLLYLCQKAMEPKRSVNLDEVYANFWPNSEKASRNFSHLLVRIKKALKIPGHLLTVSRSYSENSLINEGIYFATDYQEFEQALARAKALQRAGEWGFARREYLQAFKLFRGEPFKKNFDDWSVNFRFKILTELETEAINFAKSCIEHYNRNNARRILQKTLKIIPDSEEIKKCLETLSTKLN
ncbi:MAG: helix-turn-helix domain-containing protein [bacterium]